MKKESSQRHLPSLVATPDGRLFQKNWNETSRNWIYCATSVVPPQFQSPSTPSVGNSVDLLSTSSQVPIDVQPLTPIKASSPQYWQRIRSNTQEEKVSASSSNQLVFYVNGAKVVISNVDPKSTVNDFLRSTFALQGTKKSCSEVCL